MWTRKELKQKSMEALKRNYVSAILVGIVVAFCQGTLAMGSRVNVTVNNMPINDMQDVAQDTEIAAGVIIFAVLLILAALVIGLLVSIFFMAPLGVSGQRFFLKNLDTDESASELGWAFSSDRYRNIVHVMFMTNLSIVLHFLLLIVPGAIKAYEYMMVPYILAEDPEIEASEAKKLSASMMDGNKMDAFILQLTFIGWYILSAFTFNISGIFFSNPYIYGTNAALYKKLKELKFYGNSGPVSAAWEGGQDDDAPGYIPQLGPESGERDTTFPKPDYSGPEY